MGGEQYVIGVDFGTLSGGRWSSSGSDDGAELGEAVTEYPHGVIERAAGLAGERRRRSRRTGRCRIPTTTSTCSARPSRRRSRRRASTRAT